jgi:hypothetical protein
MGGKPKPHAVRTFGIHEQRAWMNRTHPDFRCEIRAGLLVCRGIIRPTPLNSPYRVRIEYRTGEPPLAWVEEPRLRRLNPDEPIPHTYAGDGPGEDDRPCLYLPGSGEWSSDKKLALTVVPWLSLWLFYYESWLATGEWQGGGVHPQNAPQLARLSDE